MAVEVRRLELMHAYQIITNSPREIGDKIEQNQKLRIFLRADFIDIGFLQPNN